MINFPIPRLDKDDELRSMLRPYCRLSEGEVWSDPKKKHRVICGDAANSTELKAISKKKNITLAIQDPPYNFVAFKKTAPEMFTKWCAKWIVATNNVLSKNSSLYVWLGADQKKQFEPLPEFMIMMRDSSFESKSLITLRNQRGYGSQKNWMAVRQELLYYTKGKPAFNIENVYTDIPKILKGYYKEVKGKITENFERSKSNFIRASNVWVDVQQVFHLMEENVNGCFAQKPLKAIERIINVSSSQNDWVLDSFSHSGTTLLACELNKRKCITLDIDPIYCEISIRRIENYRNNHKLGWQNSNPFIEEILSDNKIKKYLLSNYNFDVTKVEVTK